MSRMHESATHASDEGLQHPQNMVAQRRAEARLHAELQTRMQRSSSWYGASRLFLFGVAMFGLIQSIRTSPAHLWLFVVPPTLAFVVVVLLHQRVQRVMEKARRRRLLAEEAAARLEGGNGPGARGDLPPQPISELDAGLARPMDEGESHVLPPWVIDDLGVDGESPSLHQMLNTTQSTLGARRLRQVLRTPLLTARSIRRRQEGIQELAGDPRLRDALMLAFFSGRETSMRRVPGFLAQPRALPGGMFRITAAFCGILTMPLLVLGLKLPGLLPIAGLLLVVGLFLRFRVRQQITALRDGYLELEPILRIGHEVAVELDAHVTQSPLLGSQREFFREHLRSDVPYRLQRLLRYIRFLHLQEIGILYAIFDFLTQWDLQWLLALEATARPERGRLERLAGMLSNLEAHLALAVFCAEQPAVRFPEILEQESPRIKILAGEHPLLRVGHVVANDLDLGGPQRLELITGSNMAGKSTYLRMVALNTVLAQVGAPVRARAMELTPMKLHANINVRDSLADGKSYFLVEVERVEGILRAASDDSFVLGIFDELFRGTNSTERLAASREIARYLAASGGLFLLATHDVELTRLVSDEAVEGIAALHFRDEIHEGRMVFPYRAYRGVSTVHNALKLLELSGYPPALVERARRHAARQHPQA